jgi:hypothetical protein
MVNHNNIFKKIGYILNELQDQYQFLSENPDQLSEIELELFLANANFLAEHVQIVKKLTINQPLKELPQATATEEEGKSFGFQEKIADEPAKEEQSSADTAPSFEFVLTERSPEDTIDLKEVIEDNHHEEQVDYDSQEAQDIEEYDNEVTYVQPSIDEVGPEPFLVYNEVIPEEEVPQKVEPTVPPTPVAAVPEPIIPPAPVIVPEPIKHPEPVVHYQQPEPVLIKDDLKAQEIPEPTHTLTPDKVEEKVVQPSASAPRPTLNDLLAASQRTNNYSQENSSQTVTDLKKAVNLNEKLLYIKDLFNGYNLAYSEAIDIINKLPDFKSADTFLQNNYAVKNNWQSKQSTVDKFYDLLRQRFPEA